MTARPPGCRAVRQQDEWNCAPCRLVWPVDDPNPPECSPESPTPPKNPTTPEPPKANPEYVAQKLKEIQDKLKDQ